MLSSRQVYAALSLLQLVYLSAGLALGKEHGGVVAELEEADKAFGWILDYRGLDESKILYYELMLVGIKNFQK